MLLQLERDHRGSPVGQHAPVDIGVHGEGLLGYRRRERYGRLFFRSHRLPGGRLLLPGRSRRGRPGRFRRRLLVVQRRGLGPGSIGLRMFLTRFVLGTEIGHPDQIDDHAQGDGQGYALFHGKPARTGGSFRRSEVREEAKVSVPVTALVPVDWPGNPARRPPCVSSPASAGNRTPPGENGWRFDPGSHSTPWGLRPGVAPHCPH